MLATTRTDPAAETAPATRGDDAAEYRELVAVRARRRAHRARLVRPRARAGFPAARVRPVSEVAHRSGRLPLAT